MNDNCETFYITSIRLFEDALLFSWEDESTEWRQNVFGEEVEWDNNNRYYYIVTYTIYYSCRYYSTCSCMCLHAKLLQSCPTLCNPIDCSPPGSSVHGIAMPSCRGSSWPRDQTCISRISYIERQVLYYQRHLGSPYLCTHMIQWRCALRTVT